MPQPIFLPLTLRERCTPTQRRVDAVLVMDASLSMLEPAAGGTKLATALSAARVFLDQLNLGDGDEAAIVAFNSAATLLSPLTGDRAALDAAIAAIAPAPQTCIVCAVETAAAELASVRRRADAAPVLILLTDGRSNPQPIEQAVARAARPPRPPGCASTPSAWARIWTRQPCARWPPGRRPTTTHPPQPS